MRIFCILNYHRKVINNALSRMLYSTTSSHKTECIEKIRNIGILAHIDAGKTTTTERMLFYSGTIRSMGEVHHGNTVTDFMEQERQRGITITSAAVSFPWRDHQINLIDTPGHIDFTMEVEQSLAVLDGAVVVLDASAGVEAQTLTVWHQSDGYRVPRLIYLNKMDRGDADVDTCVRAVQDKLYVTPVLLHTPIRHEGKLIGLIDIINLEEIIWTQGRGQKYIKRKLTEKESGKEWESTMSHRRNIIDTVSANDDEIAEIVIQNDSLDNVEVKDVHEAIRRCTINRTLFPVLCGSSYKNIGVQTLMDAVIEYLPSPLQCFPLYNCFEDDLAARAFKVQHDDQRGVLTFFRLYGGEIKKGQKIYNLRQDKSEVAGPMYVALADEYQPVDVVTAGNIAVVSGLKSTMSGDLITSSQSAATKAKARLSPQLKDQDTLDRLTLPSAKHLLQSLDDDADVAGALLGIGTQIPEPVFLCSIEPPNVSSQPALETALAELQREDPSLRVYHDEEAGQLVLAGMGELHLEIIKERIVREYRVDAELGPLQIAYREALVGQGKNTLVVDRKIGSYKQNMTVTLSARHKAGVAADKVLRFDKTADSAANLSHIHPRHLTAIKQGVETALLHGPKLGCKLTDVEVTLHWLEISRTTSDSVVTASVVQCLRKVFKEAESMLLEPIMSLEVVCAESYSSRVLADLTRRRANLQHITVRQQNKIIECLAPLSELVGYSSNLRSMTSGLASFTMQFHAYRQMSPLDEEKAVRSVTGF